MAQFLFFLFDFGFLSAIQQEIQTVETEKLQQERMLGLIWEHPPAIDPEIVGRVMQEIRDRIRGLEERKRVLLEEEQALIVQAVTPGHRGD